MPVRIGAVSYLNTKPLIFGLRERLPDCELVLDLPSRLSDQLSAGELDIALIPSIEYFRGGAELSIVSDACIACRGAVRSVMVLFRVPPSSVRTLALDEGSRTSVALSQLLISQFTQTRPQLVALPIDADYRNADADAVLVIGDRAMHVDRSQYAECWDLGKLWNQWSGFPFVFAMWIARTADINNPAIRQAAHALQQSRDHGLACAEQIAELEAVRYKLSVDDCVAYFTRQLHFVLGPEERAGLELFRWHADQLDLLNSDHSQLQIDSPRL